MDTSARRERLLLFGGLPHRYLAQWEITSDLGVIEEKLGVRFETVPQDDLQIQYQNPTSRERKRIALLVNGLVHDAEPHAEGEMPLPQGERPSIMELEKAVRLYIAMEALFKARRGDALAITCGPWVRTHLAPVPCLALTFLREQGVPAACQGDVDALATMVALKRVGASPAFMGGAAVKQGRLSLSHCVLSRTLAGGSRQPYRLTGFHGRKPSPTLWTTVPVGEPVTVARFTRDLGSLLLVAGVSRGKGTTSSCTNELLIEVSDPDAVVDAVMGVQNHYVLVWGDHTAALAAAAGAYGVPVVRLD